MPENWWIFTLDTTMVTFTVFNLNTKADVPWCNVQICEGVGPPTGACEVVAVFEANLHHAVQTLGLVEVT